MKRAKFTIPMKSPFRYIIIALMVMLIVFGFVDIAPEYEIISDSSVTEEFYGGETFEFVGLQPKFRFSDEMEFYHIPLMIAELACAVFCFFGFTEKRPWLLALPIFIYALLLNIHFSWFMALLIAAGVILYILTSFGVIRTKIPLIIALILLTGAFVFIAEELTYNYGGLLYYEYDTYEDYIHFPAMSFAMLLLSLALTPVRAPEEQARVSARSTQ